MRDSKLVGVVIQDKNGVDHAVRVRTNSIVMEIAPESGLIFLTQCGKQCVEISAIKVADLAWAAQKEAPNE